MCTSITIQVAFDIVLLYKRCQIPTDQTDNISLAIQHVDGHFHALPLTDVLRIHKRKYREPGKVEYGTAIYRCSVLLGQISVAARSLLSLAAISIAMRSGGGCLARSTVQNVILCCLHV